MPAQPTVFGPISARGFLFDMDGTLLDSTAPMLRVWGNWCQRRGVNAATFIPTIHGLRASESIGALKLPGIDPQVEAQWIEKMEVEDVDGVVPIGGVLALLEALPRESWAIVTSAPIRLARARLAAAGIPLADIMVVGEDVRRGKPDPACFLLGAERLGLTAKDCIAFEDAPAGIASAEAAGARVVVITATHHQPHQGPQQRLHDYHGVRVESHAAPVVTLRR